MGWFSHQPDLLLALKWFTKDTSVPVSAIDLVKTWAFEIRWCRKAIFCSLWVRRQTELSMKFHLADGHGGIGSDRPSVSTTQLIQEHLINPSIFLTQEMGMQWLGQISSIFFVDCNWSVFCQRFGWRFIHSKGPFGRPWVERGEIPEGCRWPST